MNKLGWIATLCVAAWTADAAAGTTCTVEAVAQRGDPTSAGTTLLHSGNWPSINDSGRVVFVSNDSASQTGVYWSDGNQAVLPRVAGPPDGFSGMQNFASIDNAGDIVFTGFGAVPGVYHVAAGTSPGSAPAPVATGAGPINTFFSAFSMVNNHDEIVFTATRDAGGTGIFLAGSATPPVDISPPLATVGGAILNDAGQVAYYAVDGGTLKVFRRDPGGATTTLIQAGDTIGGRVVQAVSTRFAIADTGDVILPARFTNGDWALVVHDGATTSVVADTADGVFSGFNSPYGARPNLMDDGTPVFWAQLASGGEGIFNGPDPVDDRLFGTGDQVGGKTIRVVVTGQQSVNVHGDVGFLALLDTDGNGSIDENGVFRATCTSDPDGDGDGVDDVADNCPATPNADQTNSDSDPLGDACDSCPDSSDLFPGIDPVGANGCSDLDEAAVGSNHGQCVSSVRALLNDWREAGLISKSESKLAHSLVAHGGVAPCR